MQVGETKEQKKQKKQKKKQEKKKEIKRAKNAICNIEMLYKARNSINESYDNYSSMLSKAKNKTRNEEQESARPKILTPKQMLQRLPIAHAQVKLGNNSETLLIEIRQIVYSLYQLKEITKKYTIT